MNIVTPKQDLIRFLNRNYCINAHLAERLEELRDFSAFKECRQHISKAVTRLEFSMTRSEELFTNLGTVPGPDGNETMAALLEDFFSVICIHHQGPAQLYLLDYLAAADRLMAESAEMMDRTLTMLPELALSEHPLYDAGVLRPLKIFLSDTLLAA